MWLIGPLVSLDETGGNQLVESGLINVYVFKVGIVIAINASPYAPTFGFPYRVFVLGPSPLAVGL